MEQRHREIIGRAAMLVLAVGLIAASVPVFRAGWRVGREEALTRKLTHRVGYDDDRRTTGYGACFMLGGAALAIAGLYFVKLALLSHRNLDKNPPKPPVLWDNPEPGNIDGWGP
jgi:hypothetical protein